jgi:predicted lipoprotein with Yx(FWY)xxD motif
MLLAGAALVTLVASACSNSQTAAPADAAAPTSAASAPASAAAGATGALSLATAASKDHGTILTNGDGRAVYLFEADTDGTSKCLAADCVKVWPAVTSTAAASAATGVDATKLSTTKRPDGTSQVSYNNHPLYYFIKDTGPGTTTGQGIKNFGGSWYLVDPTKGAAIDDDEAPAAPAATPAPAATGNSGYGY